MDNNFEKGDILQFRSLLPPKHYAVSIGGGYIVHYNKLNILSKVKIIKETLEDYKARSNLYMYIINFIYLNCLLIRSPLLRDVTIITYNTSLLKKSPEEIEERAF